MAITRHNKLSELQNKILNRLIDKYEESGLIHPIAIRPVEVCPEYESDFKDIDIISDFDHAVLQLVKKDLVDVRTTSRGIVLIIANENKWQDYYRMLGRLDKKTERAMLINVYEKYSECSLLKDFGSEQLERLNNGKPAKYDHKRAEMILRLCLFLEDNKESILENELSITVLNDSKLWENRYRKIVYQTLTAFGKYDELICRAMTQREKEMRLFESFNVFSNPEYVYFNGDAVITFDDGRSIRLYHDLPQALPLDRLKSAVSFNIEASRIMAVENLATFSRMNTENLSAPSRTNEDSTFYICLGGYHSMNQRYFLDTVAHDNKYVRWLYFGDIDPEGFYLAESLRRSSGLPFELYHMGVPELQKYSKHTKPLEKNDVTKAKNLLDMPLYKDVAEYMLKYDCKLEQDVVFSHLPQL